MPSTKASAKTDLQAANLNPFASVAVAGGQQVHVHLTYAGVSPNLPGLIDAIETLYGAGKVTSEVDAGANARGILRLRVIP
jgi:hypothetical protein